jgi:glycosyltransferase involved in cell wall biosynthesis
MWHRDRAYGIMIPALLWNLRHLRSTLRERRSIQSLRRRGDEELFQRGLIGRDDLPPEPPVAPAPENVAGDWIVSQILYPGQDSAAGRLGAGWYGKHFDATGWSRWTRGDARCVLRVEPFSRGVLAMTMRLFERVEGERIVRVKCNGVSHSFHLADGTWESIELPAEASADGKLVIDITSPTWSPHRSFNNGEFRTLGCGVQRIEFVPNEAKAEPLYESVSVIVPTHNRWPILVQTLAALRSQTWRQMEVIVIDDGSTDGTWEKLQGWKEEHEGMMRLILLRQEHGGPGKGRNRALREATGDLVIFIGDDIIPSNGFVEQHITRQNELGEGCALLGFTDWHRDAMKVTPVMEYVNLYGAQFNYGNLTDGEEAPFGSLYTSNVSIPRAVLGDMPFDPAFTTVNWEDIDLGYRLSLRGLRIIYHRGATAGHLHPMSLRGLMRRQQQTGEIYHIILGLHPELSASPAMPAPDPPFWFSLFGYLLLCSIPLFDLLDRRGIALPDAIYLALLQCAFYHGRRRHARRARANLQHHGH